MTIAFNKCLILGGARSGKSSLAERYAVASELPVTYIATAQAKDGEMSARIAYHQAQRPTSWKLLETPLALSQAISTYSRPNTCLLIDCLTLWLTNHLCFDNRYAVDVGEYLFAQRQQLLEAIEKAQGKLIIVSNEVGHGVVPMGALSRQFVDQAGWLHQALAQKCDRVEFIMAGLPLVLKPCTSQSSEANQ